MLRRFEPNNDPIHTEVMKRIPKTKKPVLRIKPVIINVTRVAHASSPFVYSDISIQNLIIDYASLITSTHHLPNDYYCLLKIV